VAIQANEEPKMSPKSEVEKRVKAIRLALTSHSEGCRLISYGIAKQSVSPIMHLKPSRSISLSQVHHLNRLTV